jgi:hypothetical protein
VSILFTMPQSVMRACRSSPLTPRPMHPDVCGDSVLSQGSGQPQLQLPRWLQQCLLPLADHSRPPALSLRPSYWPFGGRGRYLVAAPVGPCPRMAHLESLAWHELTWNSSWCWKKALLASPAGCWMGLAVHEGPGGFATGVLDGADS